MALVIPNNNIKQHSMEFLKLLEMNSSHRYIKTVNQLMDFYGRNYKSQYPSDLAFPTIFFHLLNEKHISIINAMHGTIMIQPCLTQMNKERIEYSGQQAKRGNGKICFSCQIKFTNEDDFRVHQTSKKHRHEFLKLWLKQNMKGLLEDKHNIIVSCLEIKNCIPDLRVEIQQNEIKVLSLEISNRGASTIVLKHCEFLHKMEYACLEDKHQVTSNKTSAMIYSGSAYYIKITITCPLVGEYSAPIAMEFTRDKDSKPFHIVRMLVFTCLNEVVSSLKPVSEYKPSKIVPKAPANDIVSGLKLKKNADLYKLEKGFKLIPYYIPMELRLLLNHKFKPWHRMTEEEQEILHLLCCLYEGGLNLQNYESFFTNLLFMEQFQNEIDIRKFDMLGVTMDYDQLRKKLVLEVIGLSENRPSVLVGDHVYIRLHNSSSNREYEGIVHTIELNRIFLGVGKELLKHYTNRMKFDVRFSLSDFIYRNMHRSLSLVPLSGLSTVLFPTEDKLECSPVDPTINIKFFNKKIETNPEQKSAVNCIVQGTSFPFPYLLFGPPGTGKTVTLVESIIQIWTNFSSNILVCAPSNTAADLITERLLEHIPKSQLFRIFSSSCSWEKVPDKIKVCCNYDVNRKSYFYPSKRFIEDNYDIIITTVLTAGRLVSAEFDLDYFTHIFIDECGQAMEPETLVAISGLMNRKSENHVGQLILAGDPKQLGPVVLSPYAKKYGLDMSLLERLLLGELYQKKSDGYNTKVVTKLLRNYRSHPSILNLPNNLFYDGELQACADIGEITLFCDWEYLPKRGFPVIFHGMLGRDLREENSPSYFNPEEISVVLYYIHKIQESSYMHIPIRAKDIGIISPYRKQVQKIQQALKSQNLSEITVGSVEEFQGQERKVIIISTVRSSSNLMAMDHEYRLGFLFNPKRFNVAVTRAKCLLIIVGNPYILSLDAHWNSLLQYCYDNDSYIGIPFEPEHLSDLSERFNHLNLGKSNTEEEAENQEKIFIERNTAGTDVPESSKEYIESNSIETERIDHLSISQKENCKEASSKGDIESSGNLFVSQTEHCNESNSKEGTSSGDHLPLNQEHITQSDRVGSKTEELLNKINSSSKLNNGKENRSNEHIYTSEKNAFTESNITKNLSMEFESLIRDAKICLVS